MSTKCQHLNHVWTVESRTHYLAPNLDLCPGRRCKCGSHVITHALVRTTPPKLYLVAKIDSPAAELFAQANPALKTW